VARSFKDRFDLSVGLDEARQRFVNRVYNQIWSQYLYGFHESERSHIHCEIMTALGEKKKIHLSLTQQIGDNFLRNLEALAACRRELFDHRLRCIVHLAHEQKISNRR